MLPAEGLPPLPLGGGFDLLQGVRVIDLTTSIAGPYATMLLADMGAEVIKLERPGGGDDARAWGPPFLDGAALFYLSVNRNKRSVALEITGPEGRAAFEALVAGADLVATNQVPRVQEKLRTDHASLSRIRPDLVHLSLTGFGLDGERRDQACYDLIAEGHSSVMDLTGEPDGPAQKVGTPAADMLAGMDAAYAALAALFDRQRTGRGHKLDVSLVDSMTRFMTPRLVSYLGSGEVARRSGGRDSVIAIYQVFDTADAPITLGLGNDNIWQRFWQAAGRPEMADDPRYPSNRERRAGRAELVAEIQALLRTRPRATWLALFARSGVPAGPINRVDEVTADPALRERGLFYRIDRPGSQPVPQVNTGIRIDDAANAPRLAPPALGVDTEAVLREAAGLDDDAIARLRAAGAIA